jgi:hypothetical protein
LLAVRHGLGKHLRDIQPRDNWIKAIRYQAMASIPFCISVTACKISIVIFLIRMFGPAITISQKAFLYMLIVLAIAANTLGILLASDFALTSEEVLRLGTTGYYMSSTVQKVCGFMTSGLCRTLLALCIDSLQANCLSRA